MYVHEHKIRVRYRETDQMGFVYYGNYALYYEIGRAEMIRSIGVTYKTLENDYGIIMPVLSMETKYVGSAYYDELITVRTILEDFPTKMIVFRHEILNEQGKIINKAILKLFFMDRTTYRRVSTPEFLQEKLRPHFEDQR